MVSRKTGQDWAARNWHDRVAKGDKDRSKRVRELIRESRSRVSTPVESLHRPGVVTTISTRYATTAAPDEWAPLTAGLAAIDVVVDSIRDGQDRALLAWPERPGNGFTLSALTLREAKTSGKLAYATLAVWPWRPGLLRAARSILIHPEDLAAAALAALNERANGPGPDGGLAENELNMIELRLKDLAMKNAPARVVRGKERIDVLVRSPTLLETTAVFPPHYGSYSADPDQVLRRVRDHTFLGNPGATMTASRSALGNPTETPYALFGLPAERTTARLSRYLVHPRFEQHGLDAVIVDLTRNSRAEIGENWEKGLKTLLDALRTVVPRRPPVVVLCEDPFTLKAADRILRSHNAALKPRRPAPRNEGVYLPEAGFLASGEALPGELLPIEFTADIKEAFLAPLREKLVKLGRRFREQGNSEGARASSAALAFLRRIASLPLGTSEAQQVADLLFNSDDDGDVTARAMLRPLMALAPLAKAGAASTEASAVDEIVEQIGEIHQVWAQETPVSTKLAELLGSGERTLVAVPERQIADVLLASDRAVNWTCSVVDHANLAEALNRMVLDRVIVVGPTPTALRALLTSEGAPAKAILVGDATGSALLAGELHPLSRLPAFKSVGPRASALLEALKRGGLDERLEATESQFRVLPVPQSEEIDLTMEGSDYGGDRVVVQTSSHKISYRPTSDVLVFSSSEARPFQRISAREVERGDQILVLDEPTRESLRHALATSRKSLEQLNDYHALIAKLRTSLPGDSTAEKARTVLQGMRQIDPSVPDAEVGNIARWLTADLAQSAHDGARQPRAARDWRRFSLFMEANEVPGILAETYWKFAIVPTRSYRVQEGFQFNQRVVQFILDPESFGGARQVNATLRALWLSLLDAIDDVQNVEFIKGEAS